MKNGQLLNLNWKFRRDFDPGYLALESYDQFETVHLPHTVKEIPYDSFDEFCFCGLSTYVRGLELPPRDDGRRTLVEFEGVANYYELYVNGEKVAEHKGAYSTARYDITAYVHPGENTLLVKVDSNERSDIPPTGSTVDYLLYGGIYRDVTLYRQEAAFIANALIRYELSGGGAVLRPQLYLDNAGEAFEAQIDVEISREGRPVYRYERRARVEEGNVSGFAALCHATSAARAWRRGKAA